MPLAILIVAAALVVGARLAGAQGCNAPSAIEAESGTLVGAFTEISDSGASGGAYVQMPDGSGSTSAISGEDYAEYCFEVASTGQYVIEGVVDGRDGTSDSFFVTLEDEPVGGYLWDVPPGWTTDLVSDRGGLDPVTFTLNPGTHVLRIHGREDGTRLDRIGLVPSGDCAALGAVEAESVPLSGAFAVGTDSAASGGSYIYVDELHGSIFAPGDDYAEFCFDVPNDGTYELVGAVDGPDGDSDSFYVTVDGAPSGGYLWDVGSGWVSDAVSDRGGADPVVVDLSAGQHTVRVYLREDGTRLDSLSLSEANAGCVAPGEVEAEALTLQGTMEIASDPDASGGSYVHAPQGSGTSSVIGGADHLEVCFDVAVEGTYTVGGIVDGIDADSDSFFVTVDGAPSSGYLWDVASGWVDDTVSDRGGADPVQLSLSAGTHTIQIHLREDGTRIDTVSLDPIASSSCPAPGVIEAEDGTASGEFTTVFDALSGGGAYAYVPNGTGDDFALGDSYVEFCFGVETSDDYVLNAVVDGPDSASDSFLVTVDAEPAGGHIWDVPDGWATDTVSVRDGADPLVMSFAPGDHTVRIYLREDGARLDQVELSTEAADPGTGTGPEVDVVIPVGADIQSYVDANPEGTTFLISAGVHREQSIEPKDGMTFLGEEGTVLNGSRVVSDWSFDGVLWVSSGHFEDGYVFGECADGLVACRYPEDLFVDNVVLRRVMSLADVGSGSWYFDYGGDTIYMGDDPVGSEVELSSARWAFTGPADEVTVFGMTIEMYASPSQEGAVNARDGREEATSGWVVENNLIRWNHGYGVRVSNSTQVIDNIITQNGQIGVGGGGVGVLVEGNEISFNNYAGYKLDWEAGGTKFVDTDGLVFRDNYSHHNVGSGVWTDENNINVVVEDNLITDNGRSGIHHEVSYSAVIRNNTVERNGFLKPNWVWGAGILVDISRDVEVYGNVVRDNANGITGVFQYRDENASGAYGEWDLRDLWVHDNCIEMGRKDDDENQVTGIAQDAGNLAVYSSDNNRFENNTYVLKDDVNNGDYYRWDDVLRTQTEWQTSAGQDQTGTWTTSC